MNEIVNKFLLAGDIFIGKPRLYIIRIRKENLD